MSMERLPAEMQLLIVGQLAVKELIALTATSKLLRTLTYRIVHLKGEATLLQRLESDNVSKKVPYALLRSIVREGYGLLVRWLMRRSAVLGVSLKLGAAAQLARASGHPRLGTWIRSASLCRSLPTACSFHSSWTPHAREGCGAPSRAARLLQ